MKTKLLSLFAVPLILFTAACKAPDPAKVAQINLVASTALVAADVQIEQLTLPENGSVPSATVGQILKGINDAAVVSQAVAKRQLNGGVGTGNAAQVLADALDMLVKLDIKQFSNANAKAIVARVNAIAAGAQVVLVATDVPDSKTILAVDDATKAKVQKTIDNGQTVIDKIAAWRIANPSK